MALSIRHITRLLALLLSTLVATSSGSVERTKQNLRRRMTNETSSVMCLILEVHVRTADGSEEHLECDLISLDDGAMVHGLSIQLPEDLVENNRKALHQGEWFVRISGAKVQETLIEEYGSLRTSIWVPETAEIETIPPIEGDVHVQAVQGSRSGRYLVGEDEDRSLAVKSTVRRLMVVRVSTSDRAPTYSSAQLQQYYFDMNSYSFRRQYALCSSGWLWFKGYKAPASSVVDVYVPGSAGSFNMKSMWTAALTKLQTQLQVTSITSITDHVAFILPGGLQGGVWYGAGTVTSWRSVFSDTFGGIPNTVMHEIGHNLGMFHAGLGSDQYGDETDIMGYGAFQQFGPSKCFNGVHIWQLGWFTDRSVTVNPFSHTVVQIASFTDYGSTNSGQYVVVKVGSFHLVYNRAAGVNAGTGAVPDTVTITQPGKYSQRVGALSTTTSPFIIPNYSGSVGSLIIKVCSIGNSNGIQVAFVSIGVNVANCS